MTARVLDQSLRLDLNGNAVLARGARSDHQIAALGLRLSLHDLPDRAKGVDDRRACRVRRECGQWLQHAAAVRPGREREHVGMLRLESRHRGLQHL